MAVDTRVAERPAVAAEKRAPRTAQLPRRRARWFAPRREIPDRAYGLLAAASFAAAFLFWTWASHQSFANPVFLPPPEKVWDAALGFLSEGDLWNDVRVSFFRVTSGFLLSAMLAIPLGILIGSFKVTEGFLQPFTEFIREQPSSTVIAIARFQ